MACRQHGGSLARDRRGGEAAGLSHTTRSTRRESLRSIGLAGWLALAGSLSVRPSVSDGLGDAAQQPGAEDL